MITKRGKAVAQLVPATTRPPSLRGFLEGKIRSRADIVRPIRVAWNAARRWVVPQVAWRRVRLELPPEALRRTALRQGLREVAVSGAIGIAAAELAGLHGDPADRIVSTALSLGAALLTADDAILAWRGPLAPHDARV